MVFAQPKNAYIKDVSMPSPNAASLGKYTDTPVSYYTGIPNISVPIYTLQEGSLTLPISLSYHAGGIKLNEPSSWVGTNWAINAGGMVSRTVLGIADEGQNGYFTSGINLIDPDASSSNATNSIQKSLVLDGALDAEADIFSYNFGSYSGKFYFDRNQNVVLIPRADLKVEKIVTGGRISHIYITDPEGNRYSFGKIDPEETTDTDGTEYNYTDANGGIIYPSSWVLRKIETHDKKYFINLNYAKECYQYLSPGSFTATYTFCSGGNFSESCAGVPLGGPYDCGHTLKVKAKRLSSIVTSSETIEFVPETTDREDLDASSQSDCTGGERKALKSIKIKKSDGTCLKQFNLNYTYMVSPNNTNSLSYYKRLFLNSVQAVSCAANPPVISENPYTFEYYPGTLPNRLSKQIDHWGYYNAAVGNEGTQNVPPVTIEVAGNMVNPPYATALRESNEAAMIVGAMKKVTYPTKGYTEFTYEANDYMNQKIVPSFNFFFSASNCSTPIPPNQGGTCCGSVVNQVVTAPPPSNATTFTFTAAQLAPGAKVRMTLTPSGCSSNSLFGGLSAYNAAGTQVGGASANFNASNWPYFYTQEIILSNYFSLQPGVPYTFKISSQDCKAEFSFFTVTESIIPEIRKVGGLRIKQMKTHDNIDVANDIIKKYTYKDKLTPTYSSGFLHREPNYTGYAYSYAGAKITAFVMSNSIVALSGLDGSHFGYSRVVEEFSNGSTNNGKAEYEFETEQAITLPPLSDRYPQKQQGLSVRRGFTKNKSLYDVNNVKVFDEATILNNDNYVLGPPNEYLYKAAYIPPCSGGLSGICWASYSNATSIARPQRVTTTQDGITNITNYEYSTLQLSNLAPVAIETYRSDNATAVRTENTYIYDYPLASIKAEMISRNMIAMPIKTVTKVGAIGSAAAGTIVGGTQTLYGAFNNDGTPNTNPVFTANGPHPRPAQYYAYEKTWTNGTPSAGAFVLDGTIESYNTKGEPASFRTANWNDSETYTWNSNGLIASKTFKDFTTSYTYHSNSRLLSEITDIDGRKTAFQYDNLMRLSKVTKDKINATTWGVTTDYTYNYADGSSTNNKYNWVNEKSTLATVNSNSLLSVTETKQYMDGLGRPLQTVKKGWSPTQTDVVTGAVSYDNQGRVAKAFTPFAGGANTGNFTAIPTTQKFTTNTYEISPLNRVLTSTAPDWYPVTNIYGSNVANEVEFLNGTAGSFYPAGVLSKSVSVIPKTSTTGSAQITFTDKSGRLILSRAQSVTSLSPIQFSSADKADTYYFYDDKNRLVKVLPPGVADTPADANKRFEYTYDGRDNMLTKKVPDQDFPVKMLYNARDQMVFLQDPVMSQTSGGKWLLNLYDDYGRPIKTGFATYTGTSPSPSAPGTHSEVHTETVYGTVGIEKGKITQGKVYIPGLATPITRTMTFDAVTGRMLTNNGNNHLTSATGSDNYTYTYDYAGNVLTEVRTHKTSPTATALTLTSRKTYDHSGRNTNLHHQINSNSEKQLANYAYDFRDRIIDKSLGQHTGTVGGVPTSGFLQSLDYTYNEQNWLTGINSASAFSVSEQAIVACATNPLAVGPLTASFAANPDGNDLFKMSLNYDAPQTFTGQPVAPTGQRNGNISQLVWQVRGRERQAYNVTYDFLDRMLNATYMDINSAGTANTSNRYQENLTYADMRGNINTLTRNGMFKSTTTATCYTLGQIDNLAYTYVTGTNRLSKIADAAGTANSTQRNAGFNPAAAASTATYTYDVNGNMTNDPYKSLAISYNHLNLPTVFNFGGGKSIDILYDRGGMKLRKTVNNTGAVTLYKQDYVSGLEYRSNGSAGALTLEAIYHPEGRITPNGAAFRYEYNIKDHLGNTRLTFADINNNGAVDITGVATTTEILSENHYYPFGMNMGYDWMNNTAISPDTKYQYNGKEYNDDFGLNWNDYGARWYDGSLGRWMNIDPLAEKSVNINTYSYVKSNPMLLLDRDGMLWVNPYAKKGADYKEQAAAVTSLLDALKSQDKELYDFIDNLMYTNPDGNEQPLVVRVYLSNKDEHQADNEEDKAMAATPIGYSQLKGKYNGSDIQIPHGQGMSAKQSIIGGPRFEGEPGHINIFLFKSGMKEENKVNTLSNEAGDIMFAFEENASGIQEHKDEQNPLKKTDYRGKQSTVYSEAIEKVTRLRGEGKISQNRDVYPLIVGKGRGTFLAHDGQPIEE